MSNGKKKNICVKILECCIGKREDVQGQGPVEITNLTKKIDDYVMEISDMDRDDIKEEMRSDRRIEIENSKKEKEKKI